jgi:hypothetical protein
MSRTLIIAVVAVVVLAVGAAVALVVSSGGKPPIATTTVTTDQNAATPADQEQTETKPSAVTARTGPMAETKVAANPKPAKQETAVGDEKTAEVRQKVASMSEEERRLYERELGRRRMQDEMERRKYDLGSDRVLRRLDRDEALRLSDAQWQQVNALRDGYKPKIDQAVGALYAQQSELMSQMGPMMGRGGGNEGGNEEDRRAVFEKMNELRQQIEEAKAPIEAEYKAALSTILTAEQTAAIAQQQAENSENSGERPGRGNRGRRGDFGGPPGGGF